mmetsp:Transcript_39891/g.52207  ORF Transcript_39891/g.52207 Transcript_39891/m.52207 type:complete len:274 (-) Transcript_39891:285-1106(-)
MDSLFALTAEGVLHHSGQAGLQGVCLCPLSYLAVNDSVPRLHILLYQLLIDRLAIIRRPIQFIKLSIGHWCSASSHLGDVPQRLDQAGAVFARECATVLVCDEHFLRQLRLLVSQVQCITNKLSERSGCRHALFPGSRCQGSHLSLAIAGSVEDSLHEGRHMVVGKAIEFILREDVTKEAENLHVCELHVRMMHTRATFLSRVLLLLLLGFALRRRGQTQDAPRHSQVPLPLRFVLKLDHVGRYLIPDKFVPLLVDFLEKGWLRGAIFLHALH